VNHNDRLAFQALGLIGRADQEPGIFWQPGRDGVGLLDVRRDDRHIFGCKRSGIAVLVDNLAALEQFRRGGRQQLPPGSDHRVQQTAAFHGCSARALVRRRAVHASAA
jgi:hypothetical protein